MKKRTAVYLFIGFLFFSLMSKSQALFQKTFGSASDDYCFSVIQNTDKSFVLAGYTSGYGAGANDFYVIKTDSSGNPFWSKTYGGIRDDEAYSIKQTSDGGYIIGGYSKSFGAINYDAYLVKLNGSGDTLWTKTYGGVNNEYTNSVQQTTDGGFILAGYTTTFVTGSDSGNIYLIKTDASGNLKWTRSLGGIVAISDGYAVQQTSDNGYIITGYTNAFGELNGDAFLIKTDSLGTVALTKTYGSLGVDWGNSVKQTGDGGFIIAGSSDFDTTRLEDVYLIKTDPNGDTLWTKTYGGTGYDFGQSVEQTTDGGYIIGGYTNSYGAGSYDFYLLKTDANGVLTWSSAIGGPGDDEGNFVHQTADGGYIISGTANSFSAGDYDMYLVKTDASGNSCSGMSLPGNGKSPATIQGTQTVQAYAVNPSIHSVHTLLDTGGTCKNACSLMSIASNRKQNIVWNVFPNPNGGVFTISNNYASEEKTFVLIKNLLGETVYTSHLSLPDEINLQNMPNGTYFLEVQSNSQTYLQKIIIIK